MAAVYRPAGATIAPDARFSPEYVATSRAYLNIQVIAAEPWFRLLYEKANLPAVEAAGHVVFKRRGR